MSASTPTESDAFELQGAFSEFVVPNNYERTEDVDTYATEKRLGRSERPKQFDFKSQAHIPAILERRQQILRGIGTVDRLADMVSLQLPPVRTNLPIRGTLEAAAAAAKSASKGSMVANHSGPSPLQLTIEASMADKLDASASTSRVGQALAMSAMSSAPKVLLPRIDTTPGAFTLEHPKLFARVPLPEDPFQKNLQTAIGVTRRMLGLPSSQMTDANKIKSSRRKGEASIMDASGGGDVTTPLSFLAISMDPFDADTPPLEPLQHFRVEERLFFTEKERKVLERRGLEEKHASLAMNLDQSAAKKNVLYVRRGDTVSSSSSQGSEDEGLGFKDEEELATASRKKADRMLRKAEAKRKAQQETVLSVLKPVEYDRTVAVRRDVGLVNELGAAAGERQLVVQRAIVRQQQRQHNKTFKQELKMSNQLVRTVRLGGKGLCHDQLLDQMKLKSRDADEKRISLVERTRRSTESVLSRSALFRRNNNATQLNGSLMDNTSFGRVTAPSALLEHLPLTQSFNQQLGSHLPPIDERSPPSMSVRDPQEHLTSFFFTQPELIESECRQPAVQANAKKGSPPKGSSPTKGSGGGGILGAGKFKANNAFTPPTHQQDETATANNASPRSPIKGRLRPVFDKSVSTTDTKHSRTVGGKPFGSYSKDPAAMPPGLLEVQARVNQLAKNPLLFPKQASVAQQQQRNSKDRSIEVHVRYPKEPKGVKPTRHHAPNGNDGDVESSCSGRSSSAASSAGTTEGFPLDIGVGPSGDKGFGKMLVGLGSGMASIKAAVFSTPRGQVRRSPKETGLKVGPNFTPTTVPSPRSLGGSPVPASPKNNMFLGGGKFATNVVSVGPSPTTSPRVAGLSPFFDSGMGGKVPPFFGGGGGGGLSRTNSSYGRLPSNRTLGGGTVAGGHSASNSMLRRRSSSVGNAAMAFQNLINSGGGGSGSTNPGGLQRSNSRLSASILALCNEHHVSEEEAIEMLAEKRAAEEAERERVAILIAQQQAEEQQRRELLEKFGPITSDEVFREGAMEGYRLATEHIDRERRLQLAMRGKGKHTNKRAVGGLQSNSKRTLLRKARDQQSLSNSQSQSGHSPLRVPSGHQSKVGGWANGGSGYLTPSNLGSSTRRVSESPNAARTASFHSEATSSNSHTDMDESNENSLYVASAGGSHTVNINFARSASGSVSVLGSGSLSPIARAQSSVRIHSPTGAAAKPTTTTTAPTTNVPAKAVPASSSDTTFLSVAGPGHAYSKSTPRAPVASTVVDPLSISTLQSMSLNVDDQFGIRSHEAEKTISSPSHAQNDIIAIARPIKLTRPQVALGQQKVDILRRRSSSIGKKMMTSRSPTLNASSMPKTLKLLSDTDKASILQQAADAEVERTKQRIRRYREETQTLMDPEEAVAKFEAVQVKRFVNRVKEQHATKNTLQDLNRDFHRKEAMRPTEYIKKREAVYAEGDLPIARSATDPNGVWAKISHTLRAEQNRLLAAETHQQTVSVATPIIKFLSQHYRHPVASLICARALSAVNDGSIDERSKGTVPYSNPPKRRSITKPAGEDLSGKVNTKHSDGAVVEVGKKRAGASTTSGLPMLLTTDPSGHQTAKVAVALQSTRNYPKESPQRLFADELFPIADATDLLCDDVVSVLVYTGMFFGVPREEVTLMLQDKASALVMDHVKPLRKAIELVS